MLKQIERKRWLGLDISYVPLILSAILTIIVTYFVYLQTQSILKDRLRERLTAIASTAVLTIDPNDISALIEIEKRDPDLALKSMELLEVVSHLKNVRDANEDIRYIYIWNKTDDPEFLAFTADAEMINPIDVDGNGLIEDEEIPPAPGEPYESVGIESLEEGFEYPIAQTEFIVDRWGTFLSAFAPIKNESGETLAILGIDVLVDDFYSIVRATLFPFIALAIVLLSALSIQTVALMKIWRNRVEIVKELDRQKDELLSIVSHQLATPVSSVKWYIEMMLDGDMGALTKQQEDQVKTIQSVIDNLSDLVSMILDVSRIQLDRVKIDKSEFKIEKLIEEIFQVIEPKATEKAIHLVKEIPSILPSVILDKRLTRITLENLLTNAIKYTPKGGRVIFHLEIDESIMTYSVSDTGCGIPKKDQDKIFGKLFRASNVSNVDGNGFGLFAAKGAVEAQGGKIEFESSEGKGTKFMVATPIKEL